MNKKIMQRMGHNRELGIRIILFSVFLSSSILKSVNIHSFILETQMYIDAYMADWLHFLAKPCAIVVCTIEMLVALLAIRKEYRRIVTVVIVLLLSFFVYLTGLNLFCPTIIGSIESCGCFGELIHFTPMESFVKSIVLWVMSLVLVINSFGKYEPWNIFRLFKDKYLYICVAMTILLPLYSLLCFEILDHITYIYGFVLLCLFILLVVILSLKHVPKTKDAHEV